MLYPKKYENLSKSLLVLWVKVLIEMKKTWMWELEDLYIYFRNKEKISFEQFLDIVMFLWLSEIVDIQDRFFYIKKCT